MENIQIKIGGKTFTFKVEFEEDYDADAPWENSEGHGIVTDWEYRDKRPGELILNTNRRAKRFYDFAESVKIAKRDGWNSEPYDDNETKGERAAKAVRADYEYLRAWCKDEWRYVGVVVTLLDDEGDETEVSDSLWCVETFNDYHLEAAREIADEIAHGYGTRWGEAERQTFAYTAQGGALK